MKLELSESELRVVLSSVDGLLRHVTDTVADVVVDLASGKKSPPEPSKKQSLMDIFNGLGSMLGKPRDDAPPSEDENGEEEDENGEEEDENGEEEDSASEAKDEPFLTRVSPLRSQFAATPTRGGFVARPVEEEEGEESTELSPEEDVFLDDSKLLEATKGRDALLVILDQINPEAEYIPEGTERKIGAAIGEVYNALKASEPDLPAIKAQLEGISTSWPMTSADQMAREMVAVIEHPDFVARARTACENILTSQTQTGFLQQPVWVSSLMNWMKTQNGDIYCRRFQGFLAMMRDTGRPDWLMLGQFIQSVLSACQIQSSWLVR